MIANVVIVSDSASIDGGSARVAIGSAAHLAGRGVDVTFVAATGEPDPRLRDVPGLRLVHTGQGAFLDDEARGAAALRGLWNGGAYRALREVLSSLDPRETVVHAHGWTKALSASVFKAARDLGFPIAITVHEYFTVCPTGTLYLHPKAQPCGHRPMSPGCIAEPCDSRSYGFKAYRLVRQAIADRYCAVPRGVAAYLTVSEYSRKVIEPFLPAESRFYSVRNPVDVERRERVAPQAGAPFAYVGRLSAEKGVALLAEAARAAGVEVVFVGDGPDRQTIERINPKARVTGWVSAADAIAHVNAAKAVVVPSLWHETLGLVVLEAAACGVPAIVARDTAAAELVDDGITGLRFARGDADDLAAKLRQLEGDGTEAMGRTAYDRYWSDPATIEGHVDRLLSVYDEILFHREVMPAPVEPL